MGHTFDRLHDSRSRRSEWEAEFSITNRWLRTSLAEGEWSILLTETTADAPLGRTMSGDPHGPAATRPSGDLHVTSSGVRRRFLQHSLVLAVIWLGFNGTDSASWIIGVPSILVATWAATRFGGRRFVRLRVAGLFAYSAYFIRQSVLGGWDVARRVLTRQMPIEPGHIGYTTALPEGPARDLLLGTISLLPGTLSAGIDGNRIDVHALDVASEVEADLSLLEQRIAGIFPGVEERR